MKIKEGFVIKEIAGVWVLIPIGAKATEFMSIASLTETGALIWNMIEKGATKDQIVQATAATVMATAATVMATAATVVATATTVVATATTVMAMATTAKVTAKVTEKASIKI